ncbi:MAG TPA: alpha/beta fold hydrolase [Candidatus Dormibacteraeota bacterium]|jgi:2-succinyl-6-hydroxy-2,4-cyclohexadiene-1-carboxylate synthase|nr:alpha/beta fold hydrolase [Candidatus Dormibacteraeota bacterium]
METVTCLHGFSQFGESWEEVTSLVGGDRRWLAPDLEAHTPAGAVAEVVGLWDGLGIATSHLVGYSQGGRVALLTALAHPERVRSLVVIGAHAGLEGEERRRRRAEDLALADRIEREGIDWFAAYWASRPLFVGLARRGPAFLARLDAMRRRNRPAHLAACLRGLGAGATPPFWDRLGEIRCPTLVVAGAEDGRYLAFAQRLCEAIPAAGLAVVPRAGHAVHLERPEAFAALLAEHLAAHCRPA